MGILDFLVRFGVGRSVGIVYYCFFIYIHIFLIHRRDSVGIVRTVLYITSSPEVGEREEGEG